MTERTPTKTALAVVMLVLAGCGNKSESTSNDRERSGPAQVMVVNYPLQYFAERIGGADVEVTLPCPADVDPAFWRPEDDVLRKYQSADLVLLNGAGYAKWLGTATLDDDRLIDTGAAFKSNLIEEPDAITHSHGPGGEHSHAGIAFTTWLDPTQAAQQAEAVKTAIVEASPKDKSQFEDNFGKLRQDLEDLDKELLSAASALQGQPLLASHPVYQYLARHCNWQLKSMHWEPEEVPEQAQWDKLAELLKTHPAKWMLWEAPPHAETRKRLDELGIGVVVFYTCGNKPERGDYLTTMRSNIEALKKAR